MLAVTAIAQFLNMMTYLRLRSRHRGTSLPEILALDMYQIMQPLHQLYGVQ